MDLNLPEKRVFTGPATLWKRGFAFLLDIFIIDFFIFTAFKAVLAEILGNTTDVMSAYAMLQQNEAQANVLFMIFTVMVMLALAYFVLLEYLLGQTVGCILLNLKVVAQQGEKEFSMMTFWQSLSRNIFMIPAIPFILLWIADPLYLVLTKKGQRLTEWLSSTRVIEQFEL
jgi:uncharacterized RDD family membrane protein YckC